MANGEFHQDLGIMSMKSRDHEDIKIIHSKRMLTEFEAGRVQLGTSVTPASIEFGN
jgi:hypothetical protein